MTKHQTNSEYEARNPKRAPNLKGPNSRNALKWPLPNGEEALAEAVELGEAFCPGWAEALGLPPGRFDEERGGMFEAVMLCQAGQELSLAEAQLMSRAQLFEQAPGRMADATLAAGD